MKINIEQFRSNKAELIKSIEKQGIDSLSLFCACTGLPVIAACFYVKEDLPQYDEEMDRKIAALREFYGYD
jgi:hypothetical protein